MSSVEINQRERVRRWPVDDSLHLRRKVIIRGARKSVAQAELKRVLAHGVEHIRRAPVSETSHSNLGVRVLRLKRREAVRRQHRPSQCATREMFCRREAARDLEFYTSKCDK